MRYFRRLGFPLTQECKEVIKLCLNTYCKSASDKTFAKAQAEEFKKYCGISIDVPEPAKSVFDVKGVVSHIVLDDWLDTPKPEEPKSVVKKPSTWKPWHELRKHDVKRQWKNKHQ